MYTSRGSWSEYDLITEDGVNHGKYKCEDCMEAVIDKCEDGYIYCAWMQSGGTCEECMEIFERRTEKYD